MRTIAQLASALILALTSMLATAGASEEASAVLEAWSAAYSANEPEALVGKYWPDAVLLGTVSPVMSQGTEAIRTYFGRLKGSGNRNTLGEKRTIVLNALVEVAFRASDNSVESAKQSDSDSQKSPISRKCVVIVVTRSHDLADRNHSGQCSGDRHSNDDLFFR